MARVGEVGLREDVNPCCNFETNGSVLGMGDMSERLAGHRACSKVVGGKAGTCNWSGRACPNSLTWCCFQSPTAEECHP